MHQKISKRIIIPYSLIQNLSLTTMVVTPTCRTRYRSVSHRPESCTWSEKLKYAQRILRSHAHSIYSYEYRKKPDKVPKAQEDFRQPVFLPGMLAVQAFCPVVICHLKLYFAVFYCLPSCGKLSLGIAFLQLLLPRFMLVHYLNTAQARLPFCEKCNGAGDHFFQDLNIYIC